MKFGSPLQVVPALLYLAGGVLLFIAGGVLIGDFRVQKERARCEQIQAQLISNAAMQVKEMAERWEKENAKARALNRKLENIELNLRAAETGITDMASIRRRELSEAEGKLAQCLLDNDSIRILNNWMGMPANEEIY